MADIIIGEPTYPIGIQSFPAMIEGGYTYVDKTQFVAKLVEESKYVFLSRPRRFGKSLLLSTLQAYFEGRRELFKGLDIDSQDMDWTPRPVLYFDFNTGKYDHPDGLQNRLKASLKIHEEKYEIQPFMEDDPALRFENLIRKVYLKTGRNMLLLPLNWTVRSSWIDSVMTSMTAIRRRS